MENCQQEKEEKRYVQCAQQAEVVLEPATIAVSALCHYVVKNVLDLSCHVWMPGTLRKI